MGQSGNGRPWSGVEWGMTDKLTDQEALELEREAMDTELQGVLPGASPEAFFKLGQEAGPDGTLQGILGSLVGRPLTVGELEVLAGAYPGLTPGPYMGPILPPIDPEELARLRAEQEAGVVVPTHRAPMTHVGVIEELEGVVWFPLESFEGHPLRGRLRDQHGRRPPSLMAGRHTVQELSLMAFLSRVIDLARKAPDWVSLVVWVGDPFTVELGPLFPGSSIQGGPEERVRYALGFTRDEVEGNPMPGWITERGRTRHPRRRSRQEPMAESAPLTQVPDLQATVQRVITEHPDQVAAYRAGKTGLGFLVGRVMVLSHGTLDPRLVAEEFERLLR